MQQPDPGALVPADLWLDEGAIEQRINAVHQRYRAIQKLRQELMKEDVHFGTVGGSKKPTLYKAGAEMLCVVFSFTPDLELADKIEDWDNSAEVFLMYRYRCVLRDRSGRIVGVGEGSCHSREIKYRYRGGGRFCPSCGEGGVRRSSYAKPDGAEAWYCKECKAKFHRDDSTITGQDVSRSINPDIADQANTILKMAQKRAFIAAVLMGTMTSEFFTQDLEDFTDPDEPQAPQPRSTPQRTSTPAQQAQTTSESKPTTPAQQSTQAPINARKPSEAQMKRLWGKLHGSGKTREDLQRAVEDLGYQRIDDLTLTHYDSLCSWAERPTDAPPPPPPQRQQGPGPRKLW